MLPVYDEISSRQFLQREVVDFCDHSHNFLFSSAFPLPHPTTSSHFDKSSLQLLPSVAAVICQDLFYHIAVDQWPQEKCYGKVMFTFLLFHFLFSSTLSNASCVDFSKIPLTKHSYVLYRYHSCFQWDRFIPYKILCHGETELFAVPSLASHSICYPLLFFNAL